MANVWIWYGKPAAGLRANTRCRGAKSVARILARIGDGGTAVSAGASGGDICGQKMTKGRAGYQAFQRVGAGSDEGKALADELADLVGIVLLFAGRQGIDLPRAFSASEAI